MLCRFARDCSVPALHADVRKVVLYRAGRGMRGRARWCEIKSLGCGELNTMCRGVCEMLREEPLWLWSGMQAG
jgi:hypothetical protein